MNLVNQHQPSSVIVRGQITTIHLSDLTEDAYDPQTVYQSDSLQYTINDLTITQLSEHDTTVYGTDFRIRAGDVNEFAQTASTTTQVYATESHKQLRGTTVSVNVGVNLDLLMGMRSEFVEVLQVNLNACVSFIFHLCLSFLQFTGFTLTMNKVKAEVENKKLKGAVFKLIGGDANVDVFKGRSWTAIFGNWRVPV